MNQGQGFFAGTGLDHPNPQPAPQAPTPMQGMALVNLAAAQNTPPVCTGVAVPCRITITNRYGEPREVMVYFHLPAQTPEQLKSAVENLVAMGFNIPAQRPFERNGYNNGGYPPRHYNGNGNGNSYGQRPFRPQYQSNY